jgi:hypothetical protein
MFLFFLALAIVVGMFVPAIFGDGCDPTENCLPGYYWIPLLCNSGHCDTYAPTGYCIFCFYFPPILI